MNKGFTLVELLVVIAVAAIVAVIAIPKMTEHLTSAKEGALKAHGRGILATLVDPAGEPVDLWFYVSKPDEGHGYGARSGGAPLPAQLETMLQSYFSAMPHVAYFYLRDYGFVLHDCDQGEDVFVLITPDGSASTVTGENMSDEFWASSGALPSEDGAGWYNPWNNGGCRFNYP